MAVALAMSSPAFAQLGWALDGKCGTRKAAEEINREFCQSYVRGVVNRIVESGPGQVCLPGDVTDAHLVVIVQDYMRYNLERMDESANWVVTQAMTRAFPCR